MITIQGSVYGDLPDPLCRCPLCRLGNLAWDERWAWRCDSALDCQYGLAVDALFSNGGLDDRLRVGCDIRTLERETNLLHLVIWGVIELEWLSQQEAAAEFWCRAKEQPTLYQDHLDVGEHGALHEIGKHGTGTCSQRNAAKQQILRLVKEPRKWKKLA